MKIQKLPAETRSKLQSDVIITDAIQCVLELVHNSLDAEATGIAVRIDLKSYLIRVIDNGRGIAKDDLELVGERFMTSKYQTAFDAETSFTTYGFKGQALSSLQEVSRTLIIETKSEKDGPTFKKVFQNNKALPIIETENEKPGTGTTVTVEGFMYTMPVRRKRVNEVFDLEEIKNQLQNLAIIHYKVCFTLRNENKGIILLQTPQASSILESLKNIYGKTLVKSLKALQYKEKNYEVNGFISIKPQSQSNVQLLYLNKRIITKGVIHKFINNLTKEYSGKKALLSNSPVGQIMKSLKGSSHNVFIIQIQCPHSYYELFTNLRKTTVEFRNWKDLLKCIHKAVKRAFKSLNNSDSLSSSHHPDAEAPKDKLDKKTFGTSLLLNAVKGAPAKRSLHVKKDAKKRKKIKLSETTENSEVSLPKADKPRVDSLNTITKQKESLNDTLESPIPKMNLKMLGDTKNQKRTTVNQSFVEFYEWLKAKFETDANAFNFYNDFLQFKKTGSNLKEVLEFKSPVLGGKPKPKKVVKPKKKNVLRNKNKPDDFSAVDEDITNEKYNNIEWRMQKEVQFSEHKSSFSETNVHCTEGGCLIFDDESVFKKPESLIVFNKNRRQVDCTPSLPSSEMQFTNIMKFRNLPDSFFFQPAESLGKIPVEQTFGCSISNSWESHYQDFVSKRFLEERRNFPRPEPREREISKKNDNFYNLLEASLFEFRNKTQGGKRLRNAEIQVNMSKSAPKVDVMVQTFNEVPKSPSFESSYVFNCIAPEEVDLQKDQDRSQGSNFSQEVPHPDFWNTTAHMELEKNNKDVEKNTASSEFICGHKSHSSSKPQNERSASKETQTIAAIWTDSLTELEYANENENPNTESNFIASSANTELPKTIPIQELENLTSGPSQSNFCLTERHDCMPKGLSPSFLYSESTKIFTLGPIEKNKLKVTIDDTQTELLANIKWQDDSTGDFLKPSIPDRILFEMRQKAGENGMNYENPILSASMSYCAVKVHNLLHSFAFTKELLSDVEVLGQLDRKFIAAKIQIKAPKKMELISLFDQHAVDERIKLEELINENLSDGKLVSSVLNPPVECSLTESDVRVVTDLQDKMQNFGLSIKAVNENVIFVSEIPTFLLNKHEKDLKNKKETTLSDAVKALIVNIVYETTETRGAVSKIPKIMYDALCLEACHKAIKFNKELTVENMNEMIQKLQSCKLPFQCAHGRPSVIPIIDLEDFNSLMEENDTIDFEELKKFSHERKRDITADE